MCCEADWKREVVPDHKFDFVNVREFHKTDVWTRLKYVFKYILLLKSVAVYALDIFTAVTMISSNHWTNAITSKCGDNGSCAVDVQFDIAKWVFVGCIIFSFLLLGYETYKTKRVIDSRDISYGYTNLMANDYYSLRSYDNFCLFCHIDSSTKKKDDFAFFIFFTFKGWKRLLLADGPRQSINALLLYSFAAANDFETSNIPAYWDDSAITAMLLFSMILTELIFLGSLILLIVAAVLYVPLLCYIQGNLKEYVCHKVDKRISELIKKKQRQRIARNMALEKKLANGEIKNAKGEIVMGAMPQPTLPQVSIDDDDDMMKIRRKAEKAGLNVPSAAPSRSNSANHLASAAYEETGIYPGAPPPLASQSSYEGYGYHSQDYGGVYQSGGLAYGEEYGSSANLTAHAAPLGISYPPPMAAAAPVGSYASSALPNPYSPAGNQPTFPTSRSQQSLTGGQRALSPTYDYQRESGGGLAYDDSRSYQSVQRYSGGSGHGQYSYGHGYGQQPNTSYSSAAAAPPYTAGRW